MYGEALYVGVRPGQVRKLPLAEGLDFDADVGDLQGVCVCVCACVSLSAGVLRKQQRQRQGGTHQRRQLFGKRSAHQHAADNVICAQAAVDMAPQGYDRCIRHI